MSVRAVLCALCVTLVCVVANAAPREGEKDWDLSFRRLEQSATAAQSSVSFSPFVTEETARDSAETDPQPTVVDAERVQEETPEPSAESDPQPTVVTAERVQEETPGPSVETEAIPVVVTTEEDPKEDDTVPEKLAGLFDRPICDICPDPSECERCYCDTGECAPFVLKLVGGQEVQSGVCANCRPKRKCRKKNLWWCRR